MAIDITKCVDCRELFHIDHGEYCYECNMGFCAACSSKHLELVHDDEEDGMVYKCKVCRGVAGDSIEEDEIDTAYNDDPVCPHCGHEHEDAHEMAGDHDGEKTQHDCDDCGESFIMTTHITYTYSTCKGVSCRPNEYQNRNQIREEEPLIIKDAKFKTRNTLYEIAKGNIFRDGELTIEASAIKSHQFYGGTEDKSSEPSVGAKLFVLYEDKGGETVYMDTTRIQEVISR
jgi:uncharacterized Zn finger protein